MIAPAWNCRSWTVKKIEQQPWSELSCFQKVERLSIPLREHIVYRAFFALPKRLWHEFLFHFRHSEIRLQFNALKPRWDLIEKYGHVSDDDAVADIDSHSAILFFKSRGYVLESHPTFIRRLLARHEPVMVQKPL